MCKWLDFFSSQLFSKLIIVNARAVVSRYLIVSCRLVISRSINAWWQSRYMISNARNIYLFDKMGDAVSRFLALTIISLENNWEEKKSSHLHIRHQKIYNCIPFLFHSILICKKDWNEIDRNNTEYFEGCCVHRFVCVDLNGYYLFHNRRFISTIL
jgi:hypothetical protein